MDKIKFETLFNSIFREKLNFNYLRPALQNFGEDRVLDVLEYLLVNPPIVKIKRPYGYLYKLCEKKRYNVFDRKYK